MNVDIDREILHVIGSNTIQEEDCAEGLYVGNGENMLTQ
jgi:hypothetical protein